MVLRLAASRLMCSVLLREELSQTIRDQARAIEVWVGQMRHEREVRDAKMLLQQKTDVVRVLKEQKRRLEMALKRDYTRKISTSQLITVPAHNMDVPSLLLMEDRLTHAQEQLADTEIQLKQKCDVVLLLKQELKRAKAQVRTSA